MRYPTLFAAVLLVSLGGCSVWPTGEDIDNSIERELRSAAGDWQGETTGANSVALSFRLTESGTQLQGTGTMREQGAAGPAAITVTGTFQRPALSLTITGMVYEGHAVTGRIQTSYSNIVVADSLRLSGEGFSRSLPILLSEL